MHPSNPRALGCPPAALRRVLAAVALGLPVAARAEDPSPSMFLNHVKVLASNAYEGRGPGTIGEDRTVSYLVEQLRAIGLKPGNPDGTYVQEVPLIGFRTRAEGTLTVGPTSIPLNSSRDWVAVSRRSAPTVEVQNSELVFVGYGVVAPEYNWDDYKGLDVAGKTLVMLVNDPAVPDPANPAKLDDRVFKGRAMTYYGRWTYKYEIASAKGAAAVLLIHETEPAGYPYEVVVGSWGRENFDIPSPDGNAGRVAIEAWIANETARALFQAAGHDFDALKRAAVRPDFQPVPLGGTARFAATNSTRTIRSRNVVARLPGSDPKLRDEHIIYTAHWDHLGKDETLQGDQIYNGAADNATGVAGVLEIAKAFATMRVPPRRSILFLLVTAEEKGLLGSRYYAEHPLYPLETTLAVFNIDVMNTWGRTRDVVSVGFGNSTLDDLFVAAARAQGRTVRPDPEPEKGMFYRSDHFEFAKQGVPALNAKGGIDYIDKPADFGTNKRDEYTQRDYHKPSDEVKPDWDVSGAIEDLKLLIRVGLEVAQGSTYPEWKPGTEFRAKREAMLKAARP